MTTGATENSLHSHTMCSVNVSLVSFCTLASGMEASHGKETLSNADQDDDNIDTDSQSDQEGRCWLTSLTHTLLPLYPLSCTHFSLFFS